MQKQDNIISAVTGPETGNVVTAEQWTSKDTEDDEK